MSRRNKIAWDGMEWLGRIRDASSHRRWKEIVEGVLNLCLPDDQESYVFSSL
jgi:hypothetical protein